MTRSIILLFFVACASITYSQPAIEWQRNLGGSLDEYGTSIQQTSDGGYILCGTTWSNNIHVSGNHGNADIWVLKLDPAGEIDWQRCLGGSEDESADHILELQGGGYLVLGGTVSNDGDVSANNGNRDFWLVRLDSEGNLIWQHCYGGSQLDSPNDMTATPDGGFIIAGSSLSSDGDVTANAGNTDYWILKLNADLEIEWQRSYGGSAADDAFAIALTSDGGYVLNGISYSSDGDISANIGSGDYWVVKLDAFGEMVWERSFGGSDLDFGVRILELSDGNFIAAGFAYSQDNDITDPLGLNDIWSIMLSAAGEILDARTYGGSNADSFADLVVTLDDGIVFCGTSRSTDGDLLVNQGESDAWIFRTDSNGEIIWNIQLGGSDLDSFLKVIATDDNGYIAVGASSSSDGDLTGNYGGGDIWVLKFGPDVVGVGENKHPSGIQLYPNPCKERLYITSPYCDGGPVALQIFDAQGRKVAHSIMANSMIDINISQLEPGQYNVVLQYTSGRSSASFVKE